MAEKIAVVTESSYGLGFAIIKSLCQKYEGTVYMTAKSESNGLEALEKLWTLGLKPAFHPLKVSDKESVKTFALFLKEKHGGLDVLVNNIPTLAGSDYPGYNEAKSTIEAGYESFLILEEFLFPLLRSEARVVNISSDCGHLSNLHSHEWIEKLKSPDLTTEDVNVFVNDYLETVRNGTFEKSKFADEGKHADERVVKVAVTALTMIQQRKYNSRNISINAIHPGISTHREVKTPDEAAQNILYLILDASPNLKGTFMWHDRKLVDWYDAEEDNGVHYCKM